MICTLAARKRPPATPLAVLACLNALGASPADWMFRAIDSNGNPVFDSDGLIKAATVIGEASFSGNWSSYSHITGTGGSSGATGIGGENLVASAAFSLSRQGSVLLIATISGSVAVGGSGTIFGGSPIYGRVEGLANSGLASLPAFGAGPPTTTATVVKPYIGLDGGSYTAKLLWNSLNGTNDTLGYVSYELLVLQLGS